MESNPILVIFPAWSRLFRTHTRCQPAERPLGPALEGPPAPALYRVNRVSGFCLTLVAYRLWGSWHGTLFRLNADLRNAKLQ